MRVWREGVEREGVEVRVWSEGGEGGCEEGGCAKVDCECGVCRATPGVN